jgi:hypothetical protein
MNNKQKREIVVQALKACNARITATVGNSKNIKEYNNPEYWESFKVK